MRVEAVDVEAELAPEAIEVQCRAALERVRGRSGCSEVLILTDVFGATPGNIAQRLAEGGRVQLVAGVNVPMLWRALNYAHEPLETLAARAVAGGTQGVMQIDGAGSTVPGTVVETGARR